MEACASAHFWARRLIGLGFEIVLLPPHYVRPYVRRNNTDRTDCEHGADLLDYLTRAITAHRQSDSAPKLLPVT